MIGAAVGIVHGTAGHECPAKISAAAAGGPDQLRIDAFRLCEPFPVSPLQDFQVQEHPLRILGEAVEVNIVFLQPHLLADQNLRMDPVQSLEQRKDVPRNGSVFRGHIQYDGAAVEGNRPVDPYQGGQFRPPATRRGFHPSQLVF